MTAAQWGRWGEIAAALLSAGAGIYLLTKNSVPIDVGGEGGQSWLEIIAHGIGAYFLARGIWMFAHTGVQRSANEALDRLVELGGGWSDDDEPT